MHHQYLPRPHGGYHEAKSAASASSGERPAGGRSPMGYRNTRPTTGGRARWQSECVDSVSGSQRPDPARLPLSVAAPARGPSWLSTPRSDGPEPERDVAASPEARCPAETAGSGGARVG